MAQNDAIGLRAGKKRLEGKVALISGGAGGCGEAASLLFAAEGAKIAIVDRQGAAALALAEKIHASGGTAIGIEADVSSKAAVDAAVAKTLSAFGTIDVLFNHAGTIVVKPFLETSEEEWDWLMAVNVKSMFLMCKAVLPSMLKSGKGSIVNTSSISAITATPLEVLYCTTKGAVHQFSRALAVEYRDRGIRVNAVCPGFIRTAHGLREVSELSAQGIDASEAAMKAMQGRMCEPIEVAQAALFLASDDASFVSGSHLFVDNTFTAI
jgi:NAD(P)-dependent dehydrogenase (short-subunit alcohol dehydrogenase family)